jgi:hypothetical protein
VTSSPDRFDGVEIDKHQARFSGTIELTASEADRLGLDAEAIAVVTFTVNGASVLANSAGDLVRTNKFKVRDFAVVNDPDLRKQLLGLLPVPGSDDPELPFEPPQVLDEAPPHIDTETGEITVPDYIDDVAPDYVSPDRGERVAVGGARSHDTTLRKFLDGDIQP